MLTLPLGPLALPVAPLLWLGSLLLAQAVAGVLLRRAPPAGERAGEGPEARVAREAREAAVRAARDSLQGAALLGFAAARIAFVAAAPAAYFGGDGPWWAVLDLRDGGWSPLPGVLLALAWLAWRAGRRPGLRRPLAAGVLAGGLAWLAASGALGLHETRPLPPYGLQDLAGQPRPLPTGATGRPRVINLWASWCPPCHEEMPALIAARAAHPEIDWLFVNQGEDAAIVQRYVAFRGLPPEAVALDPAAGLGPLLGSSGLPTTLFVDAEGRIVHHQIGLISAAALRVRVAALTASR